MTVLAVQLPKPLTPSLTPSNHPLPTFTTHFRFLFSLSTQIAKLFLPNTQTLIPKFPSKSRQVKTTFKSFLHLHSLTLRFVIDLLFKVV